MAAQGLSKAEYLRRYLSGPAAAETAQLRRRRKKKPPGGAGTDGMRIVDDDVSWNSIAAVQEKEDEEDEGDMPVVAEFIDERPGEVKLMEEFRTNTKWKLLGDQNDDSQSLDISVPAKLTMRRQRHDSPDLSPPRRKHNGSPNLSLPRRKRHHSPDLSPPKRQRHDSPDLSPPRRQRHDSPDLSPKRVNSGMGKKGCKTTDKSQFGLVSADVLRREQQELRRHERSNKHLEEESRHSETVFRDKSGRRRDLAQERLEQRQKAEAKSERDEQYAKWGKGGGVGGMWLRAEFEPATRRARVSHMSETLPQLLLPLLDVHWECCACGGSSGLWSILQAEEATVNDCLVLE
ncbi:BUD13 homolog isoform 2-T2 [Cariama cristata]